MTIDRVYNPADQQQAHQIMAHNNNQNHVLYRPHNHINQPIHSIQQQVHVPPSMPPPPLPPRPSRHPQNMQILNQQQHIEPQPVVPVQDPFKEEVIQSILAAKEALEKPIEERDERDIMLIDNLCSLVHGFGSFPKSIRRALAAQVVLIVIDERGKELIVHNEELDSFCVLIFGECEQLNVTKTRPVRQYHIGDAFGVLEPTTEITRFIGYMVTKCENCAFLCVKRDDFFTILTDTANYPSKAIIRHKDRNGSVICVSQCDTSKKTNGPLWSYHMQSRSFSLVIPDGHVIIKATELCLMMALVDGYDQIDSSYIDDFLLLFRVFMTYEMTDRHKKIPPGMTSLCLKLAEWLDNAHFREKVIKIILTWLSNYYHDFELNPEFSYSFIKLLESKLLNLSMNNQLHLLHATISTQSKLRHVTISRSSREQPLVFSIGGGYEKNCGIFVTKVHDSNLDELMDGNIVARTSSKLKIGDQIIEVNGTNFSAIKLAEAQKKLDLSTHLSLTVRYNPSAFHEMRALPEGRRKSSMSSISTASPFPTNGQMFTFNETQDTQHGISKINNDPFPPISPLFSANANFNFKSIVKTAPKSDRSRISNLISTSKQFVKQIRDSAANQTSIETASKTSDNISDDQSNDLDLNKMKLNNELHPYLNPAVITENHSSHGSSNQTVVNVVRVFNAANNDSRYLLIHEETTAREVVMIAVKEFNLTQTTSSLDWALYEVSVVPESRTVKQKCLSDQTSRLAERASICSRFYIKNNNPNSLMPSRLDMGDDTLVNEILKESPAHVTLTSLNATLLAVELTLADFDKFKAIEPQQFVYDTFFECSDKQQRTPNFNNPNRSLSSQDTASLNSSSSEGQESLHSLNKTRTIPAEWMQEYRQFAELSNREMFWVICEILNERNIGRRVKIVKQFVRVADVCSQLRNYNSMFAIISGLGHSCLSRLKRTFDKLKPKYKNQLEKMRSLFDPSKNMSNYRMCLGQTPPPAIPLFPQIKKDLTFTKEGRSIFVSEPNDVSDDDEDTQQLSDSDTILVNFAEIRQFTERVRNVIYFSSVPYSNDLLTNSKESQRTQAQIKKMHDEWQMRKRIRYYLSQTLTSTTAADTSNQHHHRTNNTTTLPGAAILTATNTSGEIHQLDHVDGRLSLQTPQQRAVNLRSQDGRLNITYDERILYQRSLEIEPESNPRPQVASSNQRQAQRQQQMLAAQQQLVQHQQQQQLQLQQQQLIQQQLQHQANTLSSSSSSFSLQPQAPPPMMINLQTPLAVLPSPANSLPTLSKSSSLSSCSSFNHNLLHHHQNHPHLPSYNHSARGSANLVSSLGKFGTESTESLRKLKALSENVDNDWRSSCNNGSA